MPYSSMFLLLPPLPPSSTLFPYTTLFRSRAGVDSIEHGTFADARAIAAMKASGSVMVPTLMAFTGIRERLGDRKSTRLNSSHLVISYAVFCLKKKNRIHDRRERSSRKQSI